MICDEMEGGMDVRKYIQRGSITVEAALVVPVCFLVLMSLSCLFQAIRLQNDIQLKLLKSVQNCNSSTRHITEIQSFVEKGVLLRWEEKNGESLCYTEYSIDIPFLGKRYGKLRRYQQMVADEYDGISMITEEDVQYVYITTNGTVYHWNRECTYLQPGIQKSSLSQMTVRRNQSGEKYYPCESCCGSDGLQETARVYWTSYGNRYHSSRQCSRLKRNVRKVRFDEIGSMPACSKCGEG